MSDLEEILLIHHSHTDIGYTHDQPTVWEIHRRSLDRAIELAEADLDEEGPATFKWTVETSAPLLYWLEQASADQLDRFRTLEAEGRIEVMGLFSNPTTLYDSAAMIDSLEPIAELRDRFGLTIEYAMASDVNGQNWALADLFLDAGIEGFSMAINEHFGGSPSRPLAFDWEAPSGRTLPVWNGFHYGFGCQFLAADDERRQSYYLPHLRERLDERDHPFSAVALQTPHPFGDNGPPLATLSNLLATWNDRSPVRAGEQPRLRIATPSDWWAIIEDERQSLPTLRGDWTDYWTFGPESAAREVAVHRDSRRRLYTGDALESCLAGMGEPLVDRPTSRRAPPENRALAWWDSHLVDAHTWLPDSAVSDPHGEDTRAQQAHKHKYVYDARTRSLMHRRDALASLGSRIVGAGDE